MSVTFLTNDDEKRFVKSVNGVTPDETGNAQIETGSDGKDGTVVEFSAERQGKTTTVTIKTIDDKGGGLKGESYLPFTIYDGQDGQSTSVNLSSERKTADDGRTYTTVTIEEKNGNQTQVKSFDVYDGQAGGGSAEGAVLYTEQEMTLEQQAQARANIGAMEATYVYDYSGNILPIDKVADNYSIAGVTITHENGVLTLNGTTTMPFTLEITPKGTPIDGCDLKAGQTYTMFTNAIAGEAINADGTTGSIIMFFQYGVSATYMSSQRQDKVILSDYTATRFSLNSSKAGTTYTNYKIAPYVGQNFNDGYAGLTKRVIAPATAESVEQLEARMIPLEEDVAQLKANVTPFPTMFTDKKNRVIPIVQSESADLRLIAFADPHSTDANKYKKYNELLASGCVDGIIGLGDFNDYGTSTREGTLKYITEMVSHAGRTPNCFYVVGNHDIAFKAPNSGVVTQDNILTKKEMHDCLGRHLNGVAHFNPADTYGGYYYVDYEAAKIRMIMLNTSDIYEADGSLAYKYTESVMIQQPQVDWFVNEALDFSDKPNRSDWSVLVCCHAALFIRTMASEILAAFKNGTAINKEWTFKRRLIDGTSTVDQSNPVTITANKDYSTQGAVDVIGVLYGHDHNDVNADSNGIQFIGFICDNAHLDDYYVVNVSGLSAGGYYLTAANGKTFCFDLTEEEAASAAKVGYNKYLQGNPQTTIRVQNADGLSIKTGWSIKDASIDGRTEITGAFVQERTPGTIAEESCMIVNIDKDAREIRIIPYGVGEDRVISY